MNAMVEKRKGEDFVRDNITPQTNADAIRAMSDEELAEFLNKSACDYYCNYISECTLGTSCKQGILEWLKSEAKE